MTATHLPADPAGTVAASTSTATARRSGLAELFAATRAEGRAALVGYLPAGYPTVARSAQAYAALLDSGCDLVEVGLPYSDPVIDGPVIQAASDTARANGFRIKDIFTLVEGIAAGGGRAVVMTYINPVLAYGPDAFARDLAAAGGLGVITPDLIVDEAGEWLAAADAHQIDPIFLVAPASSPERITRTVEHTCGFLYAASTMGVTGARDQVSSAAPELVARCRALTDLPIGVGLGVRTAVQAAQIAAFADAVIVGSAFTSLAGDGGDTGGSPTSGLAALSSLSAELAQGVRSGSRPADAE